MNRIIKLITISFLVLVSYNCSDDFLDRNHPGSMSFDKIYQTKKDFEAALAGCYSSFQTQASAILFFGEHPSDNVHCGGLNPLASYTLIKRHLYTTGLDVFSSFWLNSYRTIQRVNIMLDKLSGSSLGTRTK